MTATRITGIYIPVEADLARLRSDMGKVKQIVTESATSISNSMNNALDNKQVSKGLNSLISNLGGVSRASKITGADLSKLGIDLGALRSVTGVTEAQFAKLQGQMLQTQAAKVQEKSLRDIAVAAGLTQKEVAALGAQMGVSAAAIDRVGKSMTEVGKSTQFSMAKFRDMIITVGLYTVAFQGLSAVVGGISSEFTRGLKSVEEFDLAIASTAAFITTFSADLKNGADIGAVYERAAGYAGRLNEKLEMIDANTIASGKHLQMMSETFIQHGVLLDVNNKRQVDGFTNIATALALVTAGQNQDVQMRQEINALLNGQVRATDRLPRLLQAIDPELQMHLKLWKEQGTTIENVGELLKGFSSNTGTLNNQWISVGSTMETIHNRILRGAFRPVFEDLIKLAKDLNTTLMDSEGNLTYIAIGIQEAIKGAYSLIKQLGTAAKEVPGAVVDAVKAPWNLADWVGEKIGIAGPTQQVKFVAELIGISGEKNDFGIVDKWKATAEELARLNKMQDPWMVNALAAPKLVDTPDKPYKSKASDLNAAMQAEVELLKAAEENKLAIVKTYTDQMQQLNQNDYDLGLSSYSSYLDEKNALTINAASKELAAKEAVLAAARNAVSKLSPITNKEGELRPDKDAKAHADALKKVEDAEKGVADAANKLAQAQVEGSHAAQVAVKDLNDLYQQTTVSLLESQGKTVEAATLMAQYDEESVERQRLIRAANEGNAEALAIVDAQRLMSAQKIKEADLDNLTTQKDAAISLAELNGEHTKSLDLQIQLKDVEIQRAQLNGALPIQIGLLKAQRREMEAMKAPLSAFAKGWKDVIKEQKTSNELMYDLAKKVAKDMNDTFEDVLFESMKGNFEDIGDLFESLADRMLDDFLKMIAAMVVAWAEAEIISWFVGGENRFSFSASGSGGSGGGTSAGGVVGSLATAAVTSYIKEQIMAEVVTPAYEAVSSYFAGETVGTVAAEGVGYEMGGTATEYVAAEGVGFEMGGAAAAESGSVAATEAGYFVGEGGTVIVAEGGTVVAGEGAAASGTAATTGASTAGMTAAANAGVIGALVASAYIIGTSHNPDIKGQMNADRVSMDDISAVSGVGQEGRLTPFGAGGGNYENIQELNVQLANLNAVSLDAASGVMVAATGVTDSETGLTTSMNWMMYSFDAATGVWTNSTSVFDGMVAQMQELNPVTQEAIETTAQYIAEMNGVPSAADELMSAFEMMSTGVYDLASATNGAVGSMIATAASLGSTVYGSVNMGVDQTSQDLFGNGGGDGGGFATGGIHSGGWRMVGERGRELEYTPPSRIFNNTDTNSIMNGLQKNSSQAITLTVPVYVGNDKLTEHIITIADGVATNRQRQGVVGRAYA